MTIVEYCHKQGLLINVVGEENVGVILSRIIKNCEIDHAIEVVDEATKSV